MSKPQATGFISWNCPHCGHSHEKVEVKIGQGEQIQWCPIEQCKKTYLIRYDFFPSVWTSKVKWEPND